MTRTEYKIIRMVFPILDDIAITKFQDEVNHNLYFGWKLQGGLVISLTASGNQILAQAICKTEETDGYSKHS